MTASAPPRAEIVQLAAEGRVWMGPPTRSEPPHADPAALLREFWPVGPSLHQEAFVPVPLGDRVGYLASYKRVDAKPEATVSAP